MKFYTTAGDDGFTGLLGEGRVPKNDVRMEAVGALDEASAVLGLLRAVCLPESERRTILRIQRDLYHLMSEVAATKETAPRFRTINAEQVQWLEEQTDRIGDLVELPKEFIIPGDSFPGAAAAQARTVIRRAERRTADLFFQDGIENRDLLRYLNRLSSFCFVFELYQNNQAGPVKTTLAKDH